MTVNELLDLKNESYSTAPIVKAVKSSWKCLDSLCEELAKSSSMNGKADGLTSKNALDTFAAVCSNVVVVFLGLIRVLSVLMGVFIPCFYFELFPYFERFPPCSNLIVGK